MCSIEKCEKNVTICHDHLEVNIEKHSTLCQYIEWAYKVKPRPEEQHHHRKDDDTKCQPSIPQEWSTHKEGKEKVAPKQVNSLQMTGSGVLLTNIHGSERGEEDHTQGWDDNANITEYTDKKDAIRKNITNLRTTNSPGDITRIKLEVKNDNFITANGRKILKDTTFSTNIRDLMNQLIGKQKAPNDSLELNETNIEGLVDTSHKTLVTVTNYEGDTESDDKKPSKSDMVINCHAGHPELPASGLGTLKFSPEPKPRAVKEGSEVIVIGSITVGRTPHWFQGEIRDTFKLNGDTEEDANETLGITIKHPLLINHWAKNAA